ncbi:unnamed protein product, partial [Polarella glacialis]
PSAGATFASLSGNWAKFRARPGPRSSDAPGVKLRDPEPQRAAPSAGTARKRQRTGLSADCRAPELSPSRGAQVQKQRRRSSAVAPQWCRLLSVTGADGGSAGGSSGSGSRCNPSARNELWDPRRLPAEGEEALLKFLLESPAEAPTWATRLATEAALLRAMEELAAKFEASCGSQLGGRKWFAHFEQWLWSRRASTAQRPGSRGGSASVLPRGLAARRDPALERKLERAGLEPRAARLTSRALGRHSGLLAKRVARQVKESAGARHKAKVQTIVEAAHGREVSTRGNESSVVRLLYQGTEVQCSGAHLEKLRALHDRYGTGSSFESAAFCVLARLRSLQGAHERAGGMQAALHGEVFDLLHEDFGCVAECFASPLNCRWGRFCSAADLDAEFGSLGSFFDFRPESPRPRAKSHRSEG